MFYYSCVTFDNARLNLGPFWEIGESEPYRFEPWSSQTDDFSIDVCHYVAIRLAL